MIRATNINKHYGDLHVLKNVSLQINKGEIVSIVGASGAGKTTLLQILGTLDLLDKKDNLSSSLIINDTSIIDLKDTALSKFRNLNLGFIFQFHQLLPEFTALENVCIPAFIANKPKKEVEIEAKKLLEYLGLSHRIHHKPSELSGGEQQRVAVARALINKPAVIFADEPSGNLDHTTAENLHQLFFKLRDEFGQTFVIVTHNEELANMADRKLVMIDGVLLHSEPKKIIEINSEKNKNQILKDYHLNQPEKKSSSKRTGIRFFIIGISMLISGTIGILSRNEPNLFTAIPLCVLGFITLIVGIIKLVK